MDLMRFFSKLIFASIGIVVPKYSSNSGSESVMTISDTLLWLLLREIMKPKLYEIIYEMHACMHVDSVHSSSKPTRISLSTGIFCSFICFALFIHHFAAIFQAPYCTEIYLMVFVIKIEIKS